MTTPNERQLALSVLLAMEREGAYSNLALQQQLTVQHSTAKNSFVTALVYGVAERRLTLDALIAQYAGKKKLDVEIRCILRLGFYQLLYLTRVNENTAVNETVKLCYTVKKVSAKGFVNAILRGFLRDGKAFPPTQSEDEAWSLTYSCPLWLIRQWKREYGAETTKTLLEDSIQPAPLYIRVNTEKISDQELTKELEARGITVEKTAVEHGLRLIRSGNLERLRAFREGRFYVQDLASQVCAQLAGVQPGETVYDLCAAPGSKSFTMAQQMHGEGQIVAFDLYEHKRLLIQEGAERLGLAVIQPRVADATVYDANLPLADCVLCDVPCAGLGILRRKPEIKYKEESSLDGLPALQFQILQNGARYVKQGGRLVYSTCSLSRAENEEVVARFLREVPGFEPCALPAPYSRWAEGNCITFLPQYLNSDGFFMALFVRKESDHES